MSAPAQTVALADLHGLGPRQVKTESFTLPAGEYMLRYETDGSHAFGDWNAAAPDDPEGWGITVYRPSR